MGTSVSTAKRLKSPRTREPSLISDVWVVVLDFVPSESLEEITPFASTCRDLALAVRTWLALPREVVVRRRKFRGPSRSNWNGAVKACPRATRFVRKYLRSEIRYPEKYDLSLMDGTAEEYPVPYEPLVTNLKKTSNPHLLSLFLCHVPVPAIHQIVTHTPNLRALNLLIDDRMYEGVRRPRNIVPIFHLVFSACPKLEKLIVDVHDTPLTAQQCHSFSLLHSLRELDMSDTRIEKAALPCFLGCLPKDTLKSLRCGGCDLTTPDLLPLLAPFRNLEAFTMADSVPTQAAEQLFQLLPNLTELRIFDTLLHPIAESASVPIYPRIKRLELVAQDEENTRSILQRATNLELLYISVFNDGFPQGFPANTMNLLYKLRTVEFMLTTFDVLFVVEFDTLPSLEFLAFQSCTFPDVDDDAVDGEDLWHDFGSNLHGNTPLLKTLVFGECETILAKHIKALLRTFRDRRLENLLIELADDLCEWMRYEDAPCHDFVRLLNEKVYLSRDLGVHQNIFDAHVRNYKIKFDDMGELVNGDLTLMSEDDWLLENPPDE